MTIEAIVIPKFKNPYDILFNCHTRHCHIHIYTAVSTHTLHRFFIDFFQVFCVKTCWLHNSSNLCLLVTILIEFLSCYSAWFFAILEPSLLVLWTDCAIFLPWFVLGSVLCTNPVGPHLIFEALDWFGVLNLIKTNLNWCFGFWDFCLEIKTPFGYLEIIGANWDFVGFCGIQIGHSQFN